MEPTLLLNDLMVFLDTQSIIELSATSTSFHSFLLPHIQNNLFLNSPIFLLTKFKLKKQKFLRIYKNAKKIAIYGASAFQYSLDLNSILPSSITHAKLISLKPPSKMLPLSLTHLIISLNFPNWDLAFLPPSLTHLSLLSSSKVLNSDKLPPSLKYLFIENIKTLKSYPPYLTHLKFGSAELECLNFSPLS